MGQTTSPIDADELLSALDTDTRTWLQSLITSLGEGTAGRGPDIHALLHALGPTAAQTRQVTSLLAARHAELAEIVHNFGVLARAAQSKDAELRTVVRAGDQAISALAGQDVSLRQAISRLPGTLLSRPQDAGRRGRVRGGAAADG